MERGSVSIRDLHEIERVADMHGFREQFHQALGVAQRRGLGAMQYVRSLMLTPGCNRSRVLVNVAFVADGEVHIYIGGRNLAWFYDVDDDQLGVRCLRSGSSQEVDPATLSLMLGQFDGMIAGRVEYEATPPAATELILEVLHSSGRPMSSDEIAEGAGLWERETRKGLSRLLSSSCPKRHLGKISRSDHGLFVAA